jgi:hypothetical protein
VQDGSGLAEQREDVDEPLQAKVAQRAEAPAKPNNTGLPDKLKSGIESLSGMSMDAVRVHYNSSQPTQFNAHAYAKGTENHVAPGQEKHLPHEAWHVVQQAQGRVRPTMQMKGDVPVNDDSGLEHEADVMGVRAIQMMKGQSTRPDLVNFGSANFVQRKVIVDGQPLTPLDSDHAFDGSKPVTVPKGKMDWIQDRYARKYKSIEEFQRHAGGKAVDCGLARKYGKWYRLNFFSNKQFFVLGEHHNVFGYRELINESNQSGKVLGEGGSNTLMSATPTSDLEVNTGKTALKDEQGQAREYTMENPVSKAYYGLIAFRQGERKASQAQLGNQPTLENEDTWLENYQKAKPGDRKISQESSEPYYQSGSKQVYAKLGTAAEGYDVTRTGKGVLRTLWAVINGKQTRQGFEVKAWLPMKYFMETYRPPWTDKKKEKNNDLQFNNLREALAEGAQAETEKMAGSKGDHSRLFLDQQRKLEGKTGNPTAGEQAFAHRNYAMFQSVLKAAKSGDFIMAGMGDRHVLHLQEELKKNNISVVTRSEFLSAQYTEDAITPMAEQDPKFPGKEKDLEVRKAEYLEELEKTKQLKLQESKLSEEQVMAQPVEVTGKLSKWICLLFGILIVAGTLVGLAKLYSFYVSKR